MPRLKDSVPKATGRPYIGTHDHVTKLCEFCGSIMGRRDKPFVTFARFMGQRFCSHQCHQAKRMQSATEGFWDRLEKSGHGGCWVWTGKKSHNGYGLLSVKNRSVRAHRHAYTLVKGDIPVGMMILHSCDNPPCCNPEHLSIGTARDNMQDAIRKGRAPQTTRRLAK